MDVLRACCQVETLAKKGPQKGDRLEYSLKYFWPKCDWKAPGQAGMNGFRKVHVLRLACGMGFLKDAPSAPPPPAVLNIVQEPAPDETSIAFRIEHNYSQAGAYLQVETTKAMPTLKRKTAEKNYTWACGEDALASHPALKKSGELYVIRGVRHAVAAGKRCGIRVCLVSPEGVAGATRAKDFFKEISADAPMCAPEPSPEPAPEHVRARQLASREELVYAEPVCPIETGAKSGNRALAKEDPDPHD